MSRLILLAAPVACVGTGAAVGLTFDWAISQFYHSEADDVEICSTSLQCDGTKEKKKCSFNGSSGVKKNKYDLGSVFTIKNEFIHVLVNIYRSIRLMRQGTAVVVVVIMYIAFPGLWKSFYDHSESFAKAISNPKILFKAETNVGKVVLVDDYRESYFWLRDKTPEDSRVMAWWDYGYQITGIGNRTSIADGNTWNHEHIATLGKCLTSPVKEAHSYIRHLADYVLIWAGQRADDLLKSPHMARIGNSVYRNICPNDPLCSHFGFYNNDLNKPTPMMKKSLLYNMYSAGVKPNVNIDGKLFQHAFTSKYGLVHIFKVMNVSEESKAWVADPANRKCDYPGSMHCPGQYPPAEAIQKLLKTRLDFAQLEDFNRKKKDDKYVDEYMKGLRKSANM